MIPLSSFEFNNMCQKVCFINKNALVVYRKGLECHRLPNVPGESKMWFFVIHIGPFRFLPEVSEAREVKLDVILFCKFWDLLVDAAAERLRVATEVIALDPHIRFLLNELVETEEGPPQFPSMVMHSLKVVPGCCSRPGVLVLILVIREVVAAFYEFVHDVLDLVP